MSEGPEDKPNAHRIPVPVTHKDFQISGVLTVHQHEGKKYLRMVRSAILSQVYQPIPIDVYCVLQAYDVTDQAVGHAIKKLLCAGARNKGDRLADLKGALAAVSRAIEMETQSNPSPERPNEP